MPYCFDIGGTNIRFGMPEVNGDVPVIASVPTPTHSLAQFVEAISKLIDQEGRGLHDSIAISLTGVVHPVTHKVRVANIPAIDGVDIASELTKKTGLPAIVANDADCLALAEARVGVGKGANNVFAIVLGTGVGGGLVIGGNLVVGCNGATGEWGHGPIVDPTANGIVANIGQFQCGCGQVGCLDTVGGARGLERIHRSLHAENLASEQIFEKWLDGDINANKTIVVWSEMLAGPLAMIVNLLGPDIVPVGGGLSNASELITLLDEKVRKRCLFPANLPIIVPAHFKKNAGLVGAAQLETPTLQGMA